MLIVLRLTLLLTTSALAALAAGRKRNPEKPCSAYSSVPGVAFDIDGVVRQGNRPCLEGLAAVVNVQQRNWPFVFLTNGGAGRTEEEYAIKLTKMLLSADVRTCSGEFDNSTEAALRDQKIAQQLQKKMKPLHGDQFILAYSPLIDFNNMKDKNILAIGATGVERVARTYGFSHVIHANEYARRHPDQSPWFTNWVNEYPPGCPGLRGDEAAMHGPGPFLNYEKMDAIFVMSDPNFFGQALELAVDFLLSTNPFETEIEEEQPYIVFANPDLLWRAEFPQSRLGLGAFKISLQAVLHARLKSMGMSDSQILERERNRWIQLGKPMPDQYHFAEKKMDRLLRYDTEDDDTCIGKFYMIGDNHDTDIAGAVATNNQVMSDASKRNWDSVLVKTGVWRPGKPTRGATIIKENAKEAVEWIIEKHRPRPRRQKYGKNQYGGEL
jgi:HAD superfamily hydrolase (TIGR01456 family)